MVARPVPAGITWLPQQYTMKGRCAGWHSSVPEEAIREAEASWQLSQMPAARQLLDRLSPARTSILVVKDLTRRIVGPLFFSVGV